MFCSCFLPVCGLLFYILNRDFKTQKFFISIKSNLLFSFFMDHGFPIISKKVFPKVQCFLSKFYVLHFCLLSIFE